MADINRAIRRAEAWMDQIDGVMGVAQGERDGHVIIEVLARDQDVTGLLPTELDGYPVVVTVTGAFDAGA